MKEEKDLQAKDRLLNLFVDGEMTSDNAADYRAEVLSQDQCAQEEHQMILNVRRELRQYHSEKASEAISKINSGNLWDRIEKEIEREQKVILPWWKTISIPAFSMAATCAVLAFVVGVQFGTQKKITNQQIAANIETRRQDNFEFKLKPKADNVSQEIVVAANNDGELHRMPIELDSEQLIGVNHNIPLRTEGMDIDWIKSDRQYKLVPSGKTVPVIWVSGSK